LTERLEANNLLSMYVKEQKKKDEETKKLTEEIKKNQALLLQHIAALS